VGVDIRARRISPKIRVYLIYLTSDLWYLSRNSDDALEVAPYYRIDRTIRVTAEFKNETWISTRSSSSNRGRADRSLQRRKGQSIYLIIYLYL